MGIPLHQMPKIDVVLLSHNHPDHMDWPSLVWLRNRNPDLVVRVPQGDKRLFGRSSFHHIIEHGWWESQSERKSGVESIFVPAAHWSQRGLRDKNQSLWGGWVIKWRDHQIYFAGDTAYAHHFISIQKEFGSFDAALLPIGPMKPRERMCHSHLDPEQAGRAFLDVNARMLIPIHWGTFPFGQDMFDDPVVALRKWWNGQQKQLTDRQLRILKVGQRIDCDDGVV